MSGLQRLWLSVVFASIAWVLSILANLSVLPWSSAYFTSAFFIVLWWIMRKSLGYKTVSTYPRWFQRLLGFYGVAALYYIIFSTYLAPTTTWAFNWALDLAFPVVVFGFAYFDGKSAQKNK